MESVNEQQARILPYVQRLFNEWKEHGKIVIGLDFDDTISPWRLWGTKECERIINYIKEAQQTGAYVTIFSACAPDRYEYIMEYCAKYGLKIDSINSNPIPLPYGNVAKIFANIFIDDRGGMEEAIDILVSAMYLMRAEKQKELHNYPGALG